MSQEKTELLLKQLEPTNDKITRMRAAIALGNIQNISDEIMNALIDSLRNDESSKIREEAAKSLGKIGQGQEKVAIALVDAMRDDSAESVRVYSAEAMGEIGEVAIPALLDVLKKESNVEVKEKALEAIGHIGLKINKDSPDLVKRMILEMIDVVNTENKESLHRKASEAILLMGEAAIAPLIKAYRTYSSTDVLREIEITLEKLAGKLGYRNRQALIRANDTE